METILDNLEWTLEGFHKYVPLQRVTMETGVTHNNLTGKIPATVPGGVHLDLYRAGHISHPYINMNSLTAEWIENRWWVYRTTLSPQIGKHRKVELIFKGLDYEAVVIINNVERASHKGMFEFLTVDITEECKTGEPVSLTVVFKGIPDEMGQVGFTSRTSTQKSRFNYKWDFSTRLVNIGFWRDIVLRTHGEVSLRDVYVTTDYQDKGLINVQFDIENYSACEVRLTVSRDGKMIQAKEFACDTNSFAEVLFLTNPVLWYPHGHGEQNLYDLSIELIHSGKTADSQSYKIGIRSLEYNLNDNAPAHALPYTVIINGKKIYINGINMVPLDHIYGNIAFEHYRQMIHLAKNMHVNMIRIWGGGIIEHEAFYDLCDEHGIMVWQEFIQSSSGIDNIPAKNPVYLTELASAATQALKEKRNHTSLAIWCGGNELMCANNIPSDYTDMNIAMLRGLVEKYDPKRLFLPTSASGPGQNLSMEKGKSHDIHGWWEYLGNPGHYERYYDSDSMLHSEFGTEGFANVKTIKKYISPEFLTPRDINDHHIWKHRGQWWGTYGRDLKEFGEIYDMTHFQNISQWLQAEGLRFILEQNRSRKFENSGSLIWQLNEPWPNITGTYLVDYCMEQKMAYYYAKKAYSPIHACIRYRKLNIAPGETFEAEMFAMNSLDFVNTTLDIRVQDTRGNILFDRKDEVSIPENSRVKLEDLRFTLPKEYEGIFFVNLWIAGNKNTYVFSTESHQVYAKTATLRATGDENRLEIKPLSGITKSDTRQFQVTNISDHAVMHIRMEETTDCFWIYADKMFETLMPGESEIYTITYTRKTPSGFMTDSYDEATEPIVEFKGF
ncbi:MAG: hypothetical protein FWC73_12410 [Defluviitaleaceae bacterium]|nr:hypothetical protein [Defluviitaleaceae bacterium]